MPRYDLGGYLGGPRPDDPEPDHEDGPLLHFYPFTREFAQDRVGDDQEPDVEPTPDEELDERPMSEPHRPMPPEYTAEAFERVKEENRERRYRDRVARGIPTTNVRQTKSRLGRTTEYRRVEKRRQRARAEGLNPDLLGREYRLPRRDLMAEDRIYQEASRIAARLAAESADL